MELSEEQKQRIIEEEKQRLAEERYREQVRKELLKPVAASSALPESGHPAPGPNPNKLRRRVLFLG